MKVINYFDSNKKDHWLNEIGKCDWVAGEFLHHLLKSNTLFEKTGEGTKLMLITDGDELVSFCTYAPLDEIQPTELHPWLGFIYTFPKHRGKRCFGILLDEIEKIAKEEGVSTLYISTDHIGLYEKYGFGFYTTMKSIYDEMERIYIKQI